MCTPEVKDWQERSRRLGEYSRLCVQSTTACADETTERVGGGRVAILDSRAHSRQKMRAETDERVMQ
eukprot:6202379-Pleurochrysis_carterae.AAC.2